MPFRLSSCLSQRASGAFSAACTSCCVASAPCTTSIGHRKRGRAVVRRQSVVVIWWPSERSGGVLRVRLAGEEHV
ncbi:hypothetical protein PR001_g32482 [Phytophthora rubi]|uniref:Uncharacterized protein n=1 Tax=Phytophthora rubi TaxID=129364 RepID=A0A6A3GCY2_9STRA|nr:hypothetical protein PR001_g32482 [Phytophthora rubi]